MSIDVGGSQVYTRDGRMMMSPNGDVQTLTGRSVLDVGGAPIVLNPAGGPPQISRDGTITRTASSAAPSAFTGSTRTPSSSAPRIPASSPTARRSPALDFSNVGVLQGFIERGNVNPVMEMTRLIEVHRAFDALTNSMDAADTTLKTAIRELGPTA